MQYRQMKHRMHKDVIRKVFALDMYCDFDISFNANLDWHFGNETITPEQSDFKLVAAKQITHGLGFMSNLEKFKVGRSWSVAPKKYYENDPNVKYYSRMSPMDLVTYSDVISGRNIAKAALLCLSCRPPVVQTSEPISNTFDLFERAGLYSTNIPDYGFGPRLSLVAFRLRDSSIISVYINDEPELFMDGVDSGEIYWSHWEDPEFLMTTASSVYPGVTLLEKIASAGGGRLYGNITLSILEFVGHATWRVPHTIEFTNTTSDGAG